MSRKLFLSIAFLLLVGVSSGQNFTTDQYLLVQDVDARFRDVHIDYNDLRPTLNNRFMECLLMQIDADGLYFVKSDSSGLAELLMDFSTEISFTKKALNTLLESYSNALMRSKTILDSFQFIDFYEPDSLFFENPLGRYHLSSGESELKRAWLHILKYELLSQYLNDSLVESRDQNALNGYLNDRFQEEVDRELCFIDLLLSDPQRLVDDVLKAYLGAYACCFDPHSQYHLPEQSEQFLSHLSSENYGTGIIYYKSAGRCFVSEVLPFSEADNHGGVEAGDEILFLVREGNRETCGCLPEIQLEEAFYGRSNDRLEIDVKSAKSKSVAHISLPKKKIESVSNHLYAFQIETDSSKMALIRFPSFYGTLDEKSRSSASDLSHLLLEIKHSDFDGLIVDLRNNGGGSISEAIDFLSFFIDYGPLFTVATGEFPDGKLIKDTRKGNLVDLKTVFLVNEFTASAAELVASTVQSYPNALVVGARTYGKASGQIMEEFETKYRKEPQGTCLITDMKIFQFGGLSYQNIGVFPDVEFPTVFPRSIVSESALPFSLEYSDIRSFRSPWLRDEPISVLRGKFAERNHLDKIDSLYVVISNLPDSYVQLDVSDFQNPFKDLEGFYQTDSSNLKVKSLEANPSFIDRSKKLVTGLESDLYLYESFLVLSDWIKLTE